MRPLPVAWSAVGPSGEFESLLQKHHNPNRRGFVSMRRNSRRTGCGELQVGENPTIHRRTCRRAWSGNIGCQIRCRGSNPDAKFTTQLEWEFGCFGRAWLVGGSLSPDLEARRVWQIGGDLSSPRSGGFAGWGRFIASTSPAPPCPDPAIVDRWRRRVGSGCRGLKTRCRGSPAGCSQGTAR